MPSASPAREDSWYQLTATLLPSWFRNARHACHVRHAHKQSSLLDVYLTYSNQGATTFILTHPETRPACNI